MKQLIANIKQLVQVESENDYKIHRKGKEMDELDVLEDAYLIINHGVIEDFGLMKDLKMQQFDQEINAKNKIVMPCFIDCHTHLVHAASREEEFLDKIKGLSYEEIAKRGGGILNSAKKMTLIDENELYDRSANILEQVIAQGTGAIEIKSGYGLETEAELKMLRVIRRLKENFPIPIKASFLAAHTYPLEFRENHQGYIDKIIHEMLPRVAGENLADYMDVFCEQGFFSVDETDKLLEAGAKYGLRPKIHANQLYNSGGIQVGIKHNAISVDHLESLGDEEITCLQNATTYPVLLPGAAFFLAMHYQPARKLIDANLPVVIASDFNPGSSPSFNMSFMMSLACTQMKMTVNEAINATTLNAAASLEMQEQLGSIRKGKKASIIISKEIPSYNYIPYHYAHNCIEKVII